MAAIEERKVSRNLQGNICISWLSSQQEYEKSEDLY